MDELLTKVLDYSNIQKAYKQVSSNKGISGVDGVTTAELQSYMQENWERISQEIINGTYKPESVLGVEIPKQSGGKRLLGIPTVIDRLIQQSIHQVLNPIYDIEFSEFSYGFRQGRSTHHAIAQSQRYINDGYQDIIDLDLNPTCKYITIQSCITVFCNFSFYNWGTTFVFLTKGRCLKLSALNIFI